jgi:sugar O-acyltransferase (sialic acid O-acetyltransferase NeuD family)
VARIVIFGTGDIARLAHFYFKRDSPHEVVGFTVDAAFRTSDTFEGLPLVAFESVATAFPPSEYGMFIALAYGRMNHLRAERYTHAKAAGYTLVSYVSSRCTFLSDHPVGDNCFILEDNTIQPFVKIGSNVTLWSGNHIGHDSTIEDHCFLASQIVVSGRVVIKPFCFIGVNATLHNAITIAPETLIGAGAVITKDTEPKGVYVPRRAERMPKSSDEIEM